MAIAPPATVTAHTYHRNWSSNSTPVLVGCSDGALYVVKGRQMGRVLVNDHLVARLGELLGAPVTTTALVDIPQALITIEPQVAHIPSGISHGAKWIEDCTDRLTFEHAHLPENRHRFALLAILYSWAGCWSDHQFIYKKAAPQEVFSVDHGHFFQSGPNWTISGLQGAPPVVLDPVFGACALTPVELRSAARSLKSVDLSDVSAIVNWIPTDWGLSSDERAAMIEYLVRRHAQLLTVVNVSS
jgi:hypothetical protein